MYWLMFTKKSREKEAAVMPVCLLVSSEWAALLSFTPTILPFLFLPFINSFVNLFSCDFNHKWPFTLMASRTRDTRFCWDVNVPLFWPISLLQNLVSCCFFFGYVSSVSRSQLKVPPMINVHLNFSQKHKPWSILKGPEICYLTYSLNLVYFNSPILV